MISQMKSNRVPLDMPPPPASQEIRTCLLSRDDIPRYPVWRLLRPSPRRRPLDRDLEVEPGAVSALVAGVAAAHVVGADAVREAEIGVAEREVRERLAGLAQCD